MRTLLLAASLLPTLAIAAPDFTTTTGFQQTCQHAPQTAQMANANADKQAFVLCRDVALVQQVSGWLKTNMARLDQSKTGYKQLEEDLHREILLVRDHLRTTRAVLTKINLQKGDGLKVTPGTWQVDLDGDSKIDVWEKYFFAIPKAGTRPFEVHPPMNEPDYYANEYQLDASFRIDQSDILWALAYHQFAEGIIELVGAYRVNPDEQKDFERMVYLGDPKGMTRAHALITKGFETSLAMSRSVLAETDDEDEWIPNPKQKHTAFPLTLDAESFSTWQHLLEEVIPAWKGKTLLVSEKMDSGMLAGVTELCPAGQGLNIARYFQKPLKYPMQSFTAMNRDGRMHLPGGCQTVDKQHPKSGLFAYIRDYMSRHENDPQAPGMHFLRHLYWVN